MTPNATIPIPWRHKWRDVRRRFLPTVMFIAILIVLVRLWKGYASAPLLVGQAEAIPANVSCYKPGMLVQLRVIRFQKVRAGDVIGQVQVTDPKILAASLAVIQADIQAIRTGQEPIANEQRLAMEFSEMNLNWMSQRAQLGVCEADLEAAEAEFVRTQELFNEKIVSARAMDLAKAKKISLQSKVDELARSVKEEEAKIHLLQPTNAADISKVTSEPLDAAIAAEESKLQLTEADLSPVTLRASADGMVDVIYHHPGEAITAGEPIVSIAPVNAVRIIGYLRLPILKDPKVGGNVEIRTRGPNPQTATAQITEVGTQFEPLPVPLQTPVRLPNAELGLPLAINVPATLNIRPGELVDLQLRPDGQLAATATNPPAYFTSTLK